MFWHNNYAPSVQIDSLLSEEDIKLNKLMDAEDILQECKSQNKKLIDYLTRSDILEELVNLITEEPSDDLEERWRYKYSNVACELLTSDVPVLTEKLASNEMLLSKLYSFIDKDEPLNPLLASFFSKTLHALLRRASDQNWISHQFVCLQVLESLKSRKNCVDLLLQHIQTSAIMDLILILLTKIEGDEMRQNILNWLDDQQLVQRLIKLLSPSYDSRKHANASQLLCDIIKLPRAEPDKRPDLILQTLQSEETIKLILDTMLTKDKVESSIVGGVRILINLLGQKVTSITESSETYGISYSNIVEDEKRDKFALIIIPYLNDFNRLLLDPPEKLAVKTTAGLLEKPFGRTRLYILKLYVSLLSTENAKILESFAKLDTFNILLDLFFEFTWNNFLHTEVQQCLLSAINNNYSGQCELIYYNIFIKSRYIDRILEAWEDENIKISNEKTKIRSGYMGHLVVMANEIVKRSEECKILSDCLKKNLSTESMENWESLIRYKLNETNKKQQITLGEPPESYMMSSSGNSDEYTSFPQDSYCQELYSNYAEQAIVPAYEDDDYSFHKDKFNEDHSTFHHSKDQLNHESFNANNDDYERRQKLFDSICDEKKINDDTESSEWQNSNFQINPSDWLHEKKNDLSSSDEDYNDNGDGDDDDNDDNDADHNRSHNFCFENDDPWNSLQSRSLSDATSINLWNIDASEPVEQTDWANFDNFNSTSTNIGLKNALCNESKDELPNVPNTNDNISLPNAETGINLSASDYEENVLDTQFKVEKINAPAVSNSGFPETSVNIQNSNVN